MKLKVFVSWSGERSKALAVALAEWLPHVIQSVEPWTSTRNLAKGQRWLDSLGKQLSETNIMLACVTPENMNAEWLAFEAGIISRMLGDSKVCPILMGLAAPDLEGPLAQFQATALDHDDMLALLQSLNQSMGTDALTPEVLRQAFDRTWPAFEKRAAEAARIRMGRESLRDVVAAFAKYGLPEPSVARSAHFKEGFESHAIYETAMNIAQERFYVFGRKNRKMFDKDHAPFFKSLRNRVVSTGFDFKCLFLDPFAPAAVLGAAHRDANLVEQLQASIAQAHSVMTSSGLEAGKHCRTYRTHRALAYVIIDDAIAYTPIHFDADGPASAMTKCAFTVANASDVLGGQLLREFLEAFESAPPIQPPGR